MICTRVSSKSCSLRTRCAAHGLRVVRTMAAASELSGPVFFLDAFAQRQWDKSTAAADTTIDYDQAEFVKRIHEAYDADPKLIDGYAPFCKHVFVKNFIGAKLGALPITADNRHLLRSGYTRRRPDELAVLARWFVAGEVEVPEAQHLDIILYSRDQLVQEYNDMPAKDGGGAKLPDAPWGIISIKAQDEAYETPMQPITVMRNALGREEGGSGVKLDKAAYEASVKYWDKHATISSSPEPNGE